MRSATAKPPKPGIWASSKTSEKGFALCFASFWIKLRQEETLMMRHFPDEYPAYQARVKALIPFLL